MTWWFIRFRIRTFFRVTVPLWIAMHLPRSIKRWTLVHLVAVYSKLHPDQEVPRIYAMDLLAEVC